jgi:hypothetical protein
VLTLREALLVANGTLAKNTLTAAEQALVIGIPNGPSLDQIRFSIGTGAQSIAVGGTGLGGLPAIIGPVVIDGTTQPGYAGSPIIELNGTSAGAGVSGLQILAGRSTVRGLVINRSGGDGILLQYAGSNLIEGNFIGTSLGGNVDQGNGRHGVNILNSSDNLIGGTSAAARNVISGNGGRGVSINGDRNRVQGNFIGTGSDGSTAVGNDLDGVSFFGSDNTIGARLNLDQTLSGQGNRIAFNRVGVRGIESATGGQSTGNSILSNLIYSNQLAQVQLQSQCPSTGCSTPPPANNGQNAPVLTSVTVNQGIMTIVGMLSGDPNTDYFLQFFFFDQCPGGMPSGPPQSITSQVILRRTDGFGSNSFTIMIPVSSITSGFINANATDPRNNTSPYSLCAQINGGCSFSVAPTSVSYTSGGGTDVVTVTAETGCNLTAVSNNPDFITIVSGSNGTGVGSVIYSVAANLTASPRNGTMTVAGQTISISQNAQSCFFSIGSASQNFGTNGGADNVSVTAGTGCNWTAVSNNPEFITIISPTSGGGSGNGTVSYMVEANPGSPRNGTMTIAGQTFMVTQDTGCSYLIDQSSKSFPSGAGTGNINVITGPGCSWTAISNNPEFITITTGSSGTGSGTASYSIAANSSAPRPGTITVAGQTFTVFQGRSFDDVPLNHPFYTEIGRLSSRGVTVGCNATSYCPDDVVTRQQMAAFIIRALGDFDPPPPAQQRFLDVLPSNPFYAFIDQMAIRHITLGCGEGNYCPGDPVLRDQMAAFIIRSLGEFDPPAPPFQRFADVPPTNTFYRFIDRMAVLGITLGCGEGIYCPALSVSRGQMAAFLVRAFNL